MEKTDPKKKDPGFKHKLINVAPSSRIYGLKEMALKTLGTGNISLAVELPMGEDLNEWLAINTIEFYNEISLLYGTLTEFCTTQSCPIMSAGPKYFLYLSFPILLVRYEYLWADGQNIKTPLKVSASEYIDYLMTWVENQLNNETQFPCQIGFPSIFLVFISKQGVKFPKNFDEIIKVIFKRLFRVYAHIYHSHFPHIMSLGLEYHLNTCFKHFIYFIDEFKLVDDKDLAPLAELIQQFKIRKEQA